MGVPIVERSERIDTVANGVTLVRSLLSVLLATAALDRRSTGLLVAAYLIYWLGDMLDGRVARVMAQETRIGGAFDILCDRACTTLCAAGFVVHFPHTVVPIAIFLVQFCIVDTMLSLSFLCFPIKSPNYFFLVDRTLYQLNWSIPAKMANTSAVVLLCLGGQVAVAAVFAGLVLGVKVWSLRYLARSVWPARTASSAGQPVA